METKLTLRLNKNVIERAKQYAQLHKTSISRLVESYLDVVTKQSKPENEITPLVESLSGVMEVDINFDHKKEYTDYLIDKHQ
jgi:hypothetical protein